MPLKPGKTRAAVSASPKQTVFGALKAAMGIYDASLGQAKRPHVKPPKPTYSEQTRPTAKRPVGPTPGPPKPRMKPKNLIARPAGY